MKQVLIALDQLFNTLLGGMADETLSAHAHRQRLKGRPFMADLLDALFFWEADHCLESYLSEHRRSQLPKEYQL